MSFPFEAGLRQRLSQNLGAFARHPITDMALRQAAVMIVIARAEKASEACVLLTRRPAHLRRHANQFALPGGRLDAGETAMQAALRETEEELRLTLLEEDLLGTLDDYPTRSGFRITPFVAWASNAGDLDPDPGEVAHLFRIPLDELDSPDIPHLHESGDGTPPVLSAPLPTLGHHVYSPTAAMLYQFREVALHGRPTRVAHFGQPRFAWS